MKVVIFVSYAHPFVGSGLGQVARLQAESLVEKGHDVTIVSSNYPKAKKKFKHSSVTYIKLPVINYLYGLGIPVPIFIFNLEVVRLIKQSDLVHTHGMLYPHSLLAGMFAKLYKKRFILTQHTGKIVYPNKLINVIQFLAKNSLGKSVLWLSDKVIVINQGVADWLKIESNKVITVRNGIDTRLFRPASREQKTKNRKRLGIPLNKFVVLYVGRLVLKKGYKKVFDSRSNDYLTILAGGGQITNLKNIETDKVRFLGNLPQQELVKVYQSADLFILPSDSEGFPLSIQEAMGCGLPIVTTTHPGFEKYLDSEYVEFIHPKVASIKKAISMLMKDGEKLARMRKYSINMSRQAMSWEENANTLVNVYLDK